MTSNSILVQPTSVEVLPYTKPTSPQVPPTQFERRVAVLVHSKDDPIAIIDLVLTNNIEFLSLWHVNMKANNTKQHWY